MAERQLPLPGPVVKKSNVLVRASWAVKSVYEPRLVALVASRVRVEDQDFQDYEIPLSELLGGATDGRTRQLVTDVVDNLMGRVLTISRPTGWIKYCLFSKCEFDQTCGIVRARFDPDLKAHYLNLKSHFTQYSLMEFLLLPSIYSQRLFEILKSWGSLPEVVISLADLFSMLDVPDTLRRYPDFRRYVLEKAHKDITGKTALRFEWEAIKKGRAVESIRFTFGNRAKQTEEKKVCEQKKKTSENNNELLKSAVNCFREKGEKCSPKKTKKCDLCLRLVKSTKAATQDGEQMEPDTQERPYSDVNTSESTARRTVKPAPIADKFPPVDKTFKGEPVDEVRFVKFLRDNGMNEPESEELVSRLLSQGKLQDAWNDISSARSDFRALPKVQRRNFSKFLKKRFLSSFLLFAVSR